MRIEIGAGTKGTPGFLHVDAVPLDGVDVVDDGRTLATFDDACADEIYSHWLLEHVARHEVAPMLARWRTVLRPGGTLRLITNNHEAHNRCLASGEITWLEWEYLVYAVQNKRGYGVWDVHKAAWKQDLLKQVLEEAGFVDVVVKAQWECREADGRLKCPALIAEARKPDADQADADRPDEEQPVAAAKEADARSRLAGLAFSFRGTSYPYFVHSANRTWTNERAVELPIAMRVLEAAGDPSSVVEVGNVLGHYTPIAHTVVDKFERHRNVTLNVDVLDFRPAVPPALIVSISTLEHVGRAGSDRDPAAFGRAVHHLNSLLEPGGRLFFTVPLGYNPAVDAFLDRPDIDAQITFLRRVTDGNEWCEASYAEVVGTRYGRPFPCANAIAVVDSRPS